MLHDNSSSLTVFVNFNQFGLHIHIPKGAERKSGAHLGAAIVTSMLSLAQNKPIKQDVVIAGEVSLGGKIYPLNRVHKVSNHFVESKTLLNSYTHTHQGHVLAMQRSGAKTLILPAQNKLEWEHLDAPLKANFTVRFVETYDEIYNIVFYEDHDAHQPVEVVDPVRQANKISATN